MKVSCIIPCFNACETIEKTVDSILSQSMAVGEIIIVDDGSNLETKKKLSSLAERHSQIEVITQPNKGVSIARNKGVNHSKNGFILFCDADDTFESTFLSEAIFAMTKSPSTAVVMCAYTINNGHKTIGSGLPINAPFKDFLFNNYGLGNGLFRKNIFIEVGGYDEKMLDGYEDWDLNIRLKKHGWKFHVLQNKLFNYTWSSNSRNKQAISKDIQIRGYLFQKYKEDYLFHFDDLIDHFQNRIESQKLTINKREKSLDYVIGKTVLAPLRWFKRIFA